MAMDEGVPLTRGLPVLLLLLAKAPMVLQTKVRAEPSVHLPPRAPSARIAHPCETVVEEESRGHARMRAWTSVLLLGSRLQHSAVMSRKRAALAHGPAADVGNAGALLLSFAPRFRRPLDGTITAAMSLGGRVLSWQ